MKSPEPVRRLVSVQIIYIIVIFARAKHRVLLYLILMIHKQLEDKIRHSHPML